MIVDDLLTKDESGGNINNNEMRVNLSRAPVNKSVIVAYWSDCKSRNELVGQRPSAGPSHCNALLLPIHHLSDHDALNICAVQRSSSFKRSMLRKVVVQNSYRYDLVAEITADERLDVIHPHETGKIFSRNHVDSDKSIHKRLF